MLATTDCSTATRECSKGPAVRDFPGTRIPNFQAWWLMLRLKDEVNRVLRTDDFHLLKPPEKKPICSSDGFTSQLQNQQGNVNNVLKQTANETGATWANLLCVVFPTYQPVVGAWPAQRCLCIFQFCFRQAANCESATTLITGGGGGGRACVCVCPKNAYPPLLY